MHNSRSFLSGHFIPGHSGKLFVCQFGEQIAGKGILLLPSFFEEMNLSRAVAAKQARYLASQGLTVYTLDYSGTGDSEGELIEADATLWLKNVSDVVCWLAARGVESIDLWGIRAGCLLAFAALPDIQRHLHCDHLLLWKPVLSGKLFMSQFLRLKQANAMIYNGKKIDWRKKLLDESSLEVAGYHLSNDLFESIAALHVPKTIDEQLHVSWMELASAGITPAIHNVIKAWPQASHKIIYFAGPAFWQIPEIFEQQALHLSSLQLLEQSR